MTELVLNVGSAVALFPALENLLTKELPASTAWRIGKLGRLLAPEVRAFKETQESLFEKWGEEPDSAGNRRIKLEHVEEYKAEMNLLLEESLTLQGVSKINLKHLEDSQLTITPSDMLALEVVIREDEEEV